MLQHREQEQNTPLSQVQVPITQISATQPEPSKKSTWRELYEEYVTNNPVYWKESQRPDLSALNPKMRAKALANREKREASSKPAWLRLLESIAGVAIFATIIWSVTYFMGNAKMPSFALYISPLIGSLGTGVALTRNLILEREKRTWDALLLSQLTPAQILLGKVLPGLKQIGWLAFSCLLLLAPALWQGTVPLWSLAIALPLVLTAPLPGAMLALRVGLHAPSMEKGMSQASKQAIVPFLINILAAMAGVMGMVALLRLASGVLPAWFGVLALVPWLMGLLNLMWARGLWRALLRDFHKAPTDFSG